jgi:acyl carrier protein
MQAIAERVIDVISRTQKISSDIITLDKSLEELGIDSFEGINLLFALEDEFNIVIPDDGKALKTVQELVTGMQTLLQTSVK